ncbi:MAG TPA: hypothetical protein VK131_10355, partial [Candidatus Acidoferrales bacterium]|nr:hypothetical protein [Candidatus Acidoferrales bacterium]
MVAPFLPFTSQRLHEMLGHRGVIAPQPEIREVEEEEGWRHLILGADYERQDLWKPTGLRAGQKLQEPKPLFKKLDEKVVDEELGRMERSA